MSRSLTAAVLLLTSLFAGEARAFVQAESGNAAFELRGNFRWNLIGTVPLSDELPDGQVLHTTFIRLVGESYVGSAFSAEVHALQVVSNAGSQPLIGLNASAQNLLRTGERNRTAALRWTQAEDDVSAFLELDRAVVGFSLPPLDVAIGRQPINLATASFFTPNDFFAPFAAQAFFREFKPGVDAARIELELGPFSYVGVYGVLGYDHGLSPKASDPVRLADSALLGRAVTSLWTFELSLLGGAVPDRAACSLLNPTRCTESVGVIGGGAQGELFEWLGVRAEGHVRLRDRPATQLAVGFEHRFESSLFLQLEYFYNELGAGDADEYLRILPQLGDLPYFGRHLAGGGASYEITPLLTGTLSALVNFGDGSGLATVYATYSLLDEAELAISASLPWGAAPRGLDSLLPEIRSEFGLYPFSASVELRAYF